MANATETLTLRVPRGFKEEVRNRIRPAKLSPWAVQVLRNSLPARRGGGWIERLANPASPVCADDGILRLRR